MLALTGRTARALGPVAVLAAVALTVLPPLAGRRTCRGAAALVAAGGAVRR